MALFFAEVIDAFAWPCSKLGRSVKSISFRFALWLTAFGGALALTGNPFFADVLVILAAAAICVGSNLKFRALGEPLVFSDVFVIGAIFRFPGLYLFAIPMSVRLAVPAGLIALIFGGALGFNARWQPHLAGLALCLGGIGTLWPVTRTSLMRQPDLSGDVMRHGVPLTFLVYWRRWLAVRHEPIAIPAKAAGSDAELIIIVQNESFCDPQALSADNLALPGLTEARAIAWSWGELAVSSFGAYTMRAEYGVLCGVEETVLSFRRYDPFLTAQAQAAISLPSRMPGHRSIFLHPYDLRFFGRDVLMKHLGFADVLGEDAVAPARPQTGCYVSDREVAEMLTSYMQSPEQNLIYAVTMENHGPWPASQIAGHAGGWKEYLRHLNNSDAMLKDLIVALKDSKRNAVLAFFGDHRPSIRGEVEDGPARHTPYVLLRIANGHYRSGPGRADLTPAGLHHAILAAASTVAAPV